MLNEWAVVMTTSNAERKVLRGMGEVGIKPYLPMYLDVRGRARILFRNYVFALHRDETFSKLWSVRGVSRVLLNGDKTPALIRDMCLDRLRARTDNNGFIRLSDDFEVGERLRVKSGPFEGQLAIYQGQTAEERELALLELLGQPVIAEFGYNELAAA